MEFTVISPIDNSEYLTRTFHEWSEVQSKLTSAQEAYESWVKRPLEERLAILRKWVDLLAGQRIEAAEELTYQMGRPHSEAPLEMDAFVERARRVLDKASTVSLRQDEHEDGTLTSYMRQEALGVVLVHAAWNYPYIIAAHSVVPALAVGNSVLLKYSNQTPLCGLRLEKAFLESGGPEGVLQAILLPRSQAQKLWTHDSIAQVAVTGALPNENKRPNRRRHVGRGLDLGGKDPAYVRADANLEETSTQLVRAAFSNAGQSCCGVERIYVQDTVHDNFVEALKTKVESLQLGDPRKPDTTLGPMVRFQSALALHDQVNTTIRQGATPLLPNLPPERAYFHPQILVDVNHEMNLMTEETFGPAVGVMRVKDDEEAVRLMNDSRYALGCSIWTNDVELGVEIAQRVKTTTLHINRCDFLDPAIAFLGVNDSPRGFTLSHFGFQMLTSSRYYWINKL